MTQPFQMSVDINIGSIPSELVSYCEPFMPQEDPQILPYVRNHPLAPCARCTYVRAAHMTYILAHRGTPAHLRPLLAPREEQVLRLLLQGKTIRQVAVELIVAQSTIRTYVSNLYAKLGVSNRIELANAARSMGFYETL